MYTMLAIPVTYPPPWIHRTPVREHTLSWFSFLSRGVRINSFSLVSPAGIMILFVLYFILIQMIPRFPDALSTVFDGFCGAISDTRHAVSAVPTPDWLAAFKPDIVKRTQ